MHAKQILSPVFGCSIVQQAFKMLATNCTKCEYGKRYTAGNNSRTPILDETTLRHLISHTLVLGCSRPSKCWPQIVENGQQNCVQNGVLLGAPSEPYILNENTLKYPTNVRHTLYGHEEVCNGF